MTKKHFIALADTIRSRKPNLAAKTGGPNDMYLDGRMAQWELLRDALADFCASENANFNRHRWIGYIDGMNGPNGGAIKSKGARG